MSTAELATSYAALILADDGVEITVSLRPMHMIVLGEIWVDSGIGDILRRAMYTRLLLDMRSTTGTNDEIWDEGQTEWRTTSDMNKHWEEQC